MACVNKMLTNFAKHAKTKICSCRICTIMIMVDNGPEKICETCMVNMKNEYVNKKQDCTFDEYKDAMLIAAELTLDIDKQHFVYVKNRSRY